MPELPEVETVARGLARVMQGDRFRRVVLNRPDLRFPFPPGFAQRLQGQRIESLARRAKYILAHLSDGDVLLMHLGMSGRFIIHDGEAAGRPGGFYHGTTGGEAAGDPHAHVVFTMENGAEIVYSDPRRFGVMDLFPRSEQPSHKLLKDLGIEPLGNELSGAFLNTALRTRQTPLKAALLDQKIIAGIGNIYACEALFRAGLSPRRLARTITSDVGNTERAERLAGAIRAVLTEAVAAGGSTLRDYVQTDGELGYFQHAFQVYDRAGEACAKPGCTGEVSRIVQAGRSTFFCSACQR